MESCIGIGLLVSGVFLLALATTVYINEIATIEVISLLASIGAALGDHAGYYTGRLFGPRLQSSNLASRYETGIQRATTLITKHGWLAIFIGRFIPAIRSLIPALLGLSRFNRKQYTILDCLACLLWAMALGAIVMGLDLGFSLGSQNSE